MELMPGYKQTEVGVIPEDWDVKLLPDVLHFRSGKAHEQFISDTGSYVCVNPKFISTGGRVRKYSSANFSPARKGDVLMVMSDLPNGSALAKAYFVEANNTYTVNQRVCALSAYHDDPKYIFYILNRNPYFLSFDDGVNQTNLLNRVFQKCPIPLPQSTKEQSSIAEVLSDVDSLLYDLDQLVTKKRAIKQAAMQELLTGKRRLPGFEGEWEVKSLSEIGKCHRGVSYKGEADLIPHDTANTIRLLRSNNVQNSFVNISELKHVNSERVATHQILIRDDIVICMANGSKALVGKAGRFQVNDGYKYTFGAFMGCFRTNPKKADPVFAFYLLQTDRYQRLVGDLLAGSSINNLKPSSVESLEFHFPEPSEQHAIATVLSDIDTELTYLKHRHDSIWEIKQGMMQQLLTGKTRLK